MGGGTRCGGPTMRRSGRPTSTCRRPGKTGASPSMRSTASAIRKQRRSTAGGQVHLQFDEVGLVRNLRFDLDGNLCEWERRLAVDPTQAPNWWVVKDVSDPATALQQAAPELEREIFAF